MCTWEYWNAVVISDVYNLLCCVSSNHARWVWKGFELETRQVLRWVSKKERIFSLKTRIHCVYKTSCTTRFTTDTFCFVLISAISKEFWTAYLSLNLPTSFCVYISLWEHWKWFLLRNCHYFLFTSCSVVLHFLFSFLCTTLYFPWELFVVLDHNILLCFDGKSWTVIKERQWY